MSYRLLALLVASVCLTTPALSAQTLLTSEFAGALATDFDAACIAPGDNELCFGSGPLAAGAAGFDVTFSANFSFAAYGRLNTGFGANGNWYTRDGVSASFSNENFVSLALGAPVTHIGAFMNYEPNASVSPILRAFNASNELIASFNLDLLAPISTPGVQDAALFRGIEFAGGIHRIEMSGSNLSATDFLVIEADAPSSVPEPKAMLLLLAAAPLLFRRRLRRI
jgi:hypothetical protein